ncbi:MAG: hypothetical protein U9R25_08585 [Chloroflexota bacterium]|nr:hypothetical protein [Chloroflexota bacterium]
MKAKHRTLAVLVLVVALFLTTGSAAFAASHLLQQPGGCQDAYAGETIATSYEKQASNGTVSVDGWVINHRERPVDGTRTSPELFICAENSQGATAVVPVGADGYFRFEGLEPGDWNFVLQLPTDWDSIIPLAERSGVAETGPTHLEAQECAYRIVFKIRRLFDIPAIKWEDQADGTVARGEGWDITFTPYNDPFVHPQTGTTDASGTVFFTVTPGTWYITEWLKPGWIPVTPAGMYLTLDQYAPPGAQNPVVFKNRPAGGCVPPMPHHTDCCHSW